MIVCKFEEAESFETSEGIMRPIFASENIAITHLEIPAGLEVKPHSHPGGGVLILIEGSVKLIAKYIVPMKPGDSDICTSKYRSGPGERRRLEGRDPLRSFQVQFRRRISRCFVGNFGARRR